MAPPDPNPKDKIELEVLLFEDAKQWVDWLEANHAVARGVWLRLAKKAAELKSISYAEALDGALCFGWIDGQKKSYDEDSWIQKFTPRTRKSLWSKVNCAKVMQLMESGLMKPNGLAAVESAKQDGRWERAYDSPSQAQVPDDFAAELEMHPAAKEFFESLNKTNRYAILFRIQTAKKAETRSKRIREFITMLEKGEKVHP